MQMFSAMEYTHCELKLLDQRYLPIETTWVKCVDLEAVALSIESMVVRGAPAIATAAAYALVLDVYEHTKRFDQWQDYRARWEMAVSRLSRTRPTAVNLHHALSQHREMVQQFTNNQSLNAVAKAFLDFATNLQELDRQTCQAIGDHGAALVDLPISVLTHCNTGSLATAGYGTALGVIRSLHHQGKLTRVWVDETRPFLQGARLTAFELKQEGIPFSLQVDSAAAFNMKSGQVDMIVVGADRIASNGDTANKIGTYSLAVLAQYHKVPFYVAAPLSTFDPDLASGDDIPIEQRPSLELTHFGSQRVTPLDTEVWNPSFDVTPGELITGIITERGVLRPDYRQAIKKLFD